MTTEATRTQHTPGPLTVSGDFIEAEIRGRGIAGRTAIARVLPQWNSGDSQTFIRERADADARLFGAAPELLAAAEFLVEHHMKVCDETCNLVGIDAMRAAIRKARVAS